MKAIEKINNALLNVITPIGLIFKRNSLIIGENSAKVYGIVKYPSLVDYGWLSKITNIPGTIVSITWTPIDNGEFVDALNKNIRTQRGQENAAKDSLDKQRAKRAADDGEALLYQIDQDGESVGMISIVIMPMATDAESFRKISRKTESTCIASKCKIRILSHLQKQGFMQISPMYTTDESVCKITDRIAPLASFIGGYPGSSSGYNDGTGYYFAKDVLGGLIVLDIWKRGEDRTNSNIVIMGIPGVGKSTLLKHMITAEFMIGVKIIIVDPEREYKELCKKLNGDRINVGGGAGGRINPLEIRVIPRDDNDDTYIDEGNGMGDMALYLKHLEIFFSLYLPSLLDIEKAILKDCLIQLYNNFNITWNTDISTLKCEDFPIMSDLYELLLEKAKEKEKIRKESDSNIYENLAILFKDAAKGADSALWNGYTTIKTSTRCICLDTLDLQNTGDNIKRTQYFNILSWAWQEMSCNRNEKVLLICDEVYLMIDPNVPQSLVFLKNVEKRARKYEAGIAVISHSVVDFLDPSIKMYGQAILDTPCYKIIMGTDGKNLQETKELYGLTDAEEELLASKRRGHALATIGSKRMHVHFNIPTYKFKYFGSAGGR